MKWLLKPEPERREPAEKPDLQTVLIEDIIEDFIRDKDVFIEECTVSEQQIAGLAENTKQQRMCQQWGKFRRLRLTGSNFGDVLSAISRHTAAKRPYPPSLFKKLQGDYSLGTKDSIMWAQMHENHAVKKYVQKTGNTVECAGLYLFPCGYLGSTPDGIITSPSATGKGVLEVKCPWKSRNATVNEMTQAELKGKQSMKGFYLMRDLSLNVEHNYWHQVQAEMAAASTNWAHFVICTTKELKIILVKKDNQWMEHNLNKLQDFYLNELIPRFYGKEE